jgi:cell division protein FtsW (lipid II flippase)
MNYLTPAVVVILLAGFFPGKVAFVADQGEFELLQGLVGNPVTFGVLVAMALCFLLWQSYRYRTNPQVKWIWLGLIVLALVFLAKSHTRSAMVITGMLALGFCLSLQLRKTTFILVLVMGALLIAAVASEPVFDKQYQYYYNTYILKGASGEQGVLFSRQKVWETSYASAQQGGWFGAGYGVTIGDTTFQGGLTALGYGREKANAQFAIVEETGLVGLGLYSLLLVLLFIRLILAHMREKERDTKVLLGKSAYFWGLAGIAMAVAQNSVDASNSLPKSRIAPALYAARFSPPGRAKA